MAEKVEIEIPGIGLIEAKNAATEATLLEILDVLKGTQKDNNKNARDQKNSNKGSAAGAVDTAGLTQFNQQAKGAGKGLNLLSIAGRTAGLGMQVLGRGANMAAGHVGFMAKMAVSTAGATFTLGKMAMNAAESMTSLIQEMANVGDSTERAAATLGHIPVVGGLLAGVFGAVASASENVVKSFQTAASVGATFGGSVQAMSTAAGGAGMTLDQFAGLISKNSESLMLLGGTTEEGAKQFSKLAKGIQQSDVGSELQRLGFNTEQINGGMARHIGMLAKTGALQGMTNQQLVASSGAYMKELDALAKITGVSREAKEQEQAKLMKDGKIRAALAGLDADQQRQMMSYITSFPAEQQGAIADMIATGNVTTEEAIKLQSLLPGVAQQTMQFGRTLQAGGKISQDQMNQAKNSAILEAKDSVKRNKARGLYDTEANASFAGMADLAAQKVDGYSQAIGEQGKAVAKANLAENLTKAKQRLAEMSNGFQMALANSGALDGLMTVFSAFASLIMSTVVPVFTNYIVPIITNFVVPALQAVFAIAGKIAAGLSMLLMPAIDAISKALGPGSGLGGTVEFIDGVLNAVFPPLAAIVRGAIMVFEGLLEGVGFLIAPINRLFGAFGELGDGSDWLTTTLLYVGDYIGTAFKTLGFIIGGVIDVAVSVVRWFGDLVRTSETLTGAFKLVGSAIDLLRTYFSPEGFKAILASIKEFFTNGIGDFFSSLKDAMLGTFSGLLQLIGKIPGLGKLAENGKEMEKEIEDRKLAREKAATERKAEIDQLHKAAADQKTERDKKIANHSSAVKQDSKAFSDKKIHLQSMGGLNQQEEDEKKKKLEAEKAENTTVDMSDPIQMLKSFAAKQKSAFSQEAKALDAKEKSQSELNMASQELSKAQVELGKAGSAEEKKAAEEKIKAATERVKKAAKADEESEENVRKAAERIKLAKQGKDPGAVAEGKTKEQKSETGKGSEAPAKPTSEAKVPPINQDIQKNLEMVKAAMEKRGMTDPKYINATLANVMKETGGKVVEENLNYKNTSNDRIKSIFGSRAAGKTDKELDQIKSDPKQMGEMMYGNTTKMGQQMGNTEPGDGFKYRGRGNVQLTGKSNYAAASKAIYGDNRLLDNPDLVNNPAVAAEVTAWYMQKGQTGMAKTLGIDTKNMSQDQANQLATSQIAGRAIKRGEQGYLGGEVLDKVDKFSKDSKIAGIAGAPVSEEAKKAIAEGKTKPVGSTAEDTAKARADAAANDPRRTDKPVAQAETKKEEATQTPVGSMQSLIKDGIVPTTIAFQDLIKKGIMPMLTGTQVKGLDKSKEETEKAAKDKLMAEKDAKIKEAAAGLAADDALKTTATMMSQAKKVKSPLTSITDLSTIDLTKSVQPKNMSTSTSFETPKTEIIAQAEKAAAEKAAAKEKEMAEKDAKFKEAMAKAEPSNQEGALTGSSDLNTALAELIAISKRTADLNEKQLSVQSSLSGDLFA
jgi:predicted chitinase